MVNLIPKHITIMKQSMKKWCKATSLALYEGHNVDFIKRIYDETLQNCLDFEVNQKI